MVKEVKMSEEIKYLHEHRKDFFDKKYNGLHDKYFQEAYDENPGEIVAVKNAIGTMKFLTNKPILLDKHDILAGCAYRFNYNVTVPWMPYSYDYDPKYRPVFPADCYIEAKNVKKYFNLAPDSDDAKMLDRYCVSLENWECKHWESGHIVPGYDRILKIGFGGVLAECEEALQYHCGERLQFVRAMKICTEAAILYINRYADFAEELSEKADNEKQKERMLRIAKACRNIAIKPAGNFFEAVQLFWLTHEILYTETFPASISMGRFDYYMNPYLEKDLQDGTISEYEAEKIMDALWIKFSANLHAYQNITIGGLDLEGNYVANKMTYLVLETSRKFRYDQPLISLRYHKSMPVALWDESVALLRTGIGFPAFFNDEGIFETKREMGLAEEDVINYGIVGCVEPTAASGKEYGKTELLRINFAKVLEMMLTNGKSFDSDADLKPFFKHDLESITSFDEFYKWYQDELLAFTDVCMNSLNMVDATVPYFYPTPVMSIMMEGCIKNGMDVTGGGTIYNHSGINACGMANAVDSLMAIKKAVFEDRKLSLTQLAEVLVNNFNGYDDLHYYVAKKCPKYGNDIDEVDELMSNLIDCYAKHIKGKKNARGGTWQLGLYSVEDHAKMGLHTGALPNGKLQGQALANAMSPVQGADIVGPTALINSVSKTDLSVATNNMVLDVKFTPAFFENTKHIEALRMLIDTFFSKKGLEIQFNVVEKKTLLEAQEHPENYQDLVVRVSGFSAYFVTLMKATQDEIITRTEYQTI